MYIFVSEMLCNFVDCFVDIYIVSYDMDIFILKIIQV